MKFDEIKYERADLKAILEKLNALEEAYKNAKTYEEAKGIDAKITELQADELENPMSYAHIMNTINTEDKFYEDEVKYYSENLSMFIEVNNKLSDEFLNSPFKEDYFKDGKGFLLKNTEVQKRQNSPKTIKLKIEEDSLQMEYAKAVAVAKTTFNGTEMNFYGLLKEMQSSDREVRKQALKAWASLYESIAPQLDDIYDKLIINRCKQAELLEYKDYIEMAYDIRGRFDYNKEDVQEFRDAVVKYVVPLCVKFHEEQKERLNIDKLYYYDENLFYKDGALVPQGTTQELITKANAMYHEMSKETGEFFEFMSVNNYFDLETKPGKRGGGYCSALPKYRAPFIFSNFNGTSADVDVLTHEAGHAFAAFTSMHSDDPFAQNNMSMEIAEIHSMSMEHFAYPYMDKFFNEKADAYRFMHLSEALLTVPYLCAVDEFQHRVFENPNCTASDRRAYWKKIEERLLPWRDYGDNDFLNEGGFWMQKQHIFLYPFYYIDYALAAMCAFQFYKKETINHEDAWKDYYKLCQIAGKQGYLDTLKAVNLKSPLKEDTIKEVVEFVEKQAEVLKAKL